MSIPEKRRSKPLNGRQYRRHASSKRQEVGNNTQYKDTKFGECNSRMEAIRRASCYNSVKQPRKQNQVGASERAERLEILSRCTDPAISCEPLPCAFRPGGQYNSHAPIAPHTLYRRNVPMWQQSYAQSNNVPALEISDGMASSSVPSPSLRQNNYNHCIKNMNYSSEPLFLHAAEPMLSLGIAPMHSQQSTTMCSTAIPSPFDEMAQKSNSRRSSCFSGISCQCSMAEQRPDSTFGVSNNIINGSRWRWRKSNRDSRVQNIAATGRDFRYSLAESANGYTTETSSIRCADNKPSLELTSEYAKDPVMSAVRFLQSPRTPMADNAIRRQPPLTTINATSAILATNNRLASFARSRHVRDSSVLWMNSGEYGQNSETSDEFSHIPPALHSRETRTTDSHDNVKAEIPYGKGDNKTGRSSKFMVYSNHLGAAFAPSLAELRCGDMNIEELLGDAQGSSSANESSTLGSPPCFWIDVVGASIQEIHELGDMFELHPLTVEEVACGSSRDKIDTFGDYIFIGYRTLTKAKRQRCSCGEESCNLFACTLFGQPPSTEEKSRDDQVFIIVKSNCVLTFHRDYAQRETVSRVLQRLAAIRSAAADAPRDDAEPYDNGESLAGLLDFPPYIVYAILDEITDQLSPEIVEIERQVDAIDELVLGLSHAQHESALKRMGEQRRHILLTWQLAHSKPRIIEALVRYVPVYGVSGSPRLAREVMQYLGDVHGHLMAAVDSCARAEAVLARSHSNYLAKISLELSRATFDANTTTERWTMLGIIVVPINIVTSFLGVNLKVPGQDRDDTLNFFVVLACLLIYAAVTLAFWRWRQLT